MSLIDWSGISKLLGELDLLVSTGIGSLVKLVLVVVGAYVVIKSLVSKE